MDPLTLAPEATDARAPVTFCPYLPPIPVMNKLSGQLEKLAFTACQAADCAIFDECQGKRSPKARAHALLEALEGLTSAPFIGSSVKAILPRLKTALGLD